MIRLQDIQKKAEHKKSEYLKAKILNTAFFPLSLRGDKGSIHDDFATREAKLSLLFSHSKAKKGKGYSLELGFQDSRIMGRQTIITGITIESEEDYLYLLKEEKRGETFDQNLKQLRQTFCEEALDTWLLARKYEIYTKWNSDDGLWFSRIARFLLDHPDSRLFTREVNVEAPTKFLENNIASIKSLVASIRPLNEGSDDYTQLGLRRKEQLVKLRIKNAFTITETDTICGYTPILLLTPEALKTFFLAVERIFIIENETVFLTFPLKEKELCLYAGGYGILSCSQSRLLAESDLVYFGDLDEHGFAILDKFRSLYPHTQSFCMDLQTLNDHKNYCIQGKAYTSSYKHLTQDEWETLLSLQEADATYLLEQERISVSYIQKRIEERFSSVG